MKRLIVLAAASLLGCGQAPEPVDSKAGQAAKATLERLVPLSGPSPFAPAGCGTLDEPVYLALGPTPLQTDPYKFGIEGDPSIALDPADARHLVVSWKQDAALGILSAASFDGGRSWQTRVLPALTHCEDMAQERAFHSRLGFGPDGVVYLANEVDDGFMPDPRQVVTIRVTTSTSHDGGLTWQTRFLDDELDKAAKGLSTLAAEPDTAGAALVAWHTEGRVPGGTTYVSRTTDGGASWTRYVARQGLEGEFPFNRIVALRDGRLLLFSADLTPAALPAAAAAVFGAPVPLERGTTPLYVQVSLDKARTWSAPVALATVLSPQWPAVAEAEDGTLYLSWLAADPSGGTTQYVARSDDGGTAWTAPVAAVGNTDDIHAPLAVSGRGYVGFVYTDRDPGAPPDERNAWLAYSTDRGATWQRLHIAGPFTLAGSDLPTYQETTGTPDGFAAAVLLGPPYALDGRTDVFFADLRVRSAGR